MIIAINAAIIEKKKLLIVKKNLTWILPGGKREKRENDLECLSREISEELSGTLIKNIKFYKSFNGKTPNQGNFLKAKVYFAEIDGELFSVRDKDSISESNWASNFSEYNLSEISYKIISSLKQDKYL